MSNSLPILKLQREWFDKIKSGQKTVEGRPNNPEKDYYNWNAGDLIQVQFGTDTFIIEIVAKRIYPNFEKMLEAEGLENVLPGRTTIAEGIQVYNTWYSQSMIDVLGVISYQIKVTK